MNRAKFLMTKAGKKDDKKDWDKKDSKKSAIFDKLKKKKG